MMAREPKIAYVMLRNAHFGPRLAASVELCVRDLVVHSRYARTTLVVCPPVDQPFEGVEIATIPDARISGNLGKAWGVARLLRRLGVDLAIVENHLPAAAFIALTSGARAILHTHAYVKAPSSPFDGAFRGQEMRQLSGFAFVSEYALSRFRADFPGLSAPQCAVPNGLDMQAWSATRPKDRSILCVGRALRHKGHIEAMAAITRVLSSRPEWSARFMVSDPAAADREPQTVDALRAAAEGFQRPDPGRLERSLCRGQGGVGERRDRNGAHDRPRTVRPDGAGSDGERRGADHLGAGRLGRDLRRRAR